MDERVDWTDIETQLRELMDEARRQIVEESTELDADDGEAADA
jgi:hypothetical protein